VTFQLRSILLYHADGATRRLDFRVGELNVITGASKTGKSSIIDIVDYCLASRGFWIAAGAIRDSVAVYAIVLDANGQDVLVARPRPPGRQTTTTAMHLSIGDFADRVPTLAEVTPNADAESVRAVLSEMAGIEENIFESDTGTRAALSANIRHALFFTFQGQGEVANPNVLFHSQSEEWVPQAIRDVLPYFLGATDREAVIKRQRLRALRRELASLLRDREVQQAVVGTSGTALAMLHEAQQVGLLDQQLPLPQVQDEAIALLRDVSARREDAEVEDPAGGDQLHVLLEERASLRRRFSELRAEMRLLDEVVGERSDFAGEGDEHVARLVSLDLLSVSELDDRSICPLCESALEEHIPAVQDLRSALESLNGEIGAIRRGTPRMLEVKARLERDAEDLREAVRQNQAAVSELRASEEVLISLRDEGLRRAAVRGRIGLYVDSAGQVAKLAVAGRLEQLQREVASLEAELDAALLQENMESVLSRVNRRIAEIAVELNLEHSESPIRLDPRRLTVVADTAAGRVSLNEMGSGENWLGYHIATMLALHDWFIGSDRPVPRFLFLDQPSQVYFPPDSAGDEELPGADEDRRALARLMMELRDAVARHAGRFQVIVMDHADIQEDWFQNAVVERWRNGEALIPSDWL
jgi:hypothetical protein